MLQLGKICVFTNYRHSDFFGPARVRKSLALKILVSAGFWAHFNIVRLLAYFYKGQIVRAE